MKQLLIICIAIAAAAVTPAANASWTQRAQQGNREVLTSDDLGRLSLDEPANRRGKMVIRRIQPADTRIDWNTDPTGLPYLTYQFEQRTGLPTHTNNDGLNVATEELFDYPLVFLTGHFAWSFTENEIENLTRYVNRGGTILLDDCYVRRSSFTDAANSETPRIIPGAELRPVVPGDTHTNELFRLAYNFPEGRWPGGGPRMWNRWQYALNDGRPAIFFIPNDDGCAWEVSSPPTASNPIGEGIGHGGSNEWRELTYQWATNWLLFVLTR